MLLVARRTSDGAYLQEDGGWGGLSGARLLDATNVHGWVAPCSVVLCGFVSELKRVERESAGTQFADRTDAVAGGC